MSLIVQKYGGTSVANPERIRKVAERVADCKKQGHSLVVVVSAMSGVTDSLIKLSREVCDDPSEREMDMLLATGEQTTIALMSMALHHLGVDAISFTGAQAGIVTDGVHSKAKIANISPGVIQKSLGEGRVVIVAGFQGQNMEGQITTFGRGGSDLTGLALAAALGADLCQICTDVEGVYTADPRVVPKASKISEISYDEMLEMASLGSKVMQSRAVELAKKFNVKFEVHSSFSNNPGTIVKEETQSMEDVVVRGISLDRNQAKVTINGVPDKPGVAASLFKAIADAHINIDVIVQNVSEVEGADQGRTDITFTIGRDDLGKVRKVIEPLVSEVGAQALRFDEDIAKLSVVGIGMRSHSGVAANLFGCLAGSGINIEMISTSEIKITVVIKASSADEAMKVAHERFELGQA